MRCDQARQLFDAYLDGELSPALETELGAHRVRCPECRQALALLEVTGHVIESDREPVKIRAGFADRLLACMAPVKPHWSRSHRLRSGLYVTGPLAAAAVIALTFLGVFDGRGAKVAGKKEISPLAAPVEPSASYDESIVSRTVLNPGDGAEQALEEWAVRTRENLNAKLESGQSLQEYFDLTVLQWLDILNSRKETSGTESHFPGSDNLLQPEVPETGKEAGSAGKVDVEDL